MSADPDDQRTGIHPVDTYGERLVAAAGRHRASRLPPLRKLALPAIAVVAIGGGGAALAASLGASDEPRLLQEGDAITVGFEDPESGEPLRCPDGSLFTRTVDTTLPENPEPRCSDGSVPPLYADYQERERRFLEKIDSGELRDEKSGLPIMDDVPRLPTFVVPNEE